MGVIGNIGGSGGGQGTPESIVVGTGSYTVPAGKFGYLQMSATSTASGGGSNVGTGSAATNSSNQQWVPSGTSISTSGSYPSAATPPQPITVTAQSSVNINGVAVCVADARSSYGSSGGGNPGQLNSTGRRGWSLAIYSV